MKPIPKILVVHHDAKSRRKLALLMADAGFDVRVFSEIEAAAESARGEWLDLALVDHDLDSVSGQTPVEALKKIQPTLPILLVVPQLELPLVVQGIRLGVSDVVAFCEDPRQLLRRVHALLKSEQPAESDESVTAEDLAQIDSVLENLNAEGAPSGPETGAPTEETKTDLMKLSMEKVALEAKVARLLQEKGGLETELRTLLAQGADASRLDAELAELRNERELGAATQAAIDAKAGELGAIRAKIAEERTALEKERLQLSASASANGRTADETARERADIGVWRQRLESEEDRLAGEAGKLRQDAVQLTRERRRWQEDLDLLRSQEENLRAYEARLRQIQAQLESDRVLWFSTNARPVPPSPFANDAALKEAWTKLQRASELLEAERSNFRDDRLAMQEHQMEVKRREAAVDAREVRLALREKKLSELPPAPSKAARLAAIPAEAVRGITRSPMEIAKLVLGGRKKA